MHVKNMMVLGKLCLILVCSNSYAQSWQTPVYNNWNSGDSLFGFAYNMTKFFSKRLKPEDQALHSQSVYHALSNLENGETVEWFNDRTDAQGKAKIVYTFPANGSICRRVHSWVRFGVDSKNFEDTACFNNVLNTWNFIDKY
jgi:surface antigen